MFPFAHSQFFQLLLLKMSSNSFKVKPQTAISYSALLFLVSLADMCFLLFLSTGVWVRYEVWTKSYFHTLWHEVKPRELSTELMFGVTEFQVLDLGVYCVKWQWFTKVVPSLCSYFQHNSTTVSRSMLSDGSKVTNTLQWFLISVFTQRFPLRTWICSQ